MGLVINKKRKRRFLQRNKESAFVPFYEGWWEGEYKKSDMKLHA